jgi:hypothetical protein
VKDLAVFDWGIVAVSLIKPVERFLADTLGLIGKETLGTVVERARSDSALQPRYKDLEQLNNFFRRGKHIVPPPIDYSDIPTVRREVFEILEFACQLSRRVR